MDSTNPTYCLLIGNGLIVSWGNSLSLMNAANNEIVATWHPWQKKTSFYCPSCDTKLSSKDPLLPKKSSCPKCHQVYLMHHASYPVSKITGFVLLALLMSWFNVGRFIVLIFFAFCIAPALFRNSKRRLKIPTLPYLIGSVAAAGWIVAVVCGFLWFVAYQQGKIYQREIQRKDAEMFEDFRNIRR